VTTLALILVLIAALLHATWNLFAKQAGGGLPFVWLVGGIICLLYLPVVAWWTGSHGSFLSASAVAWIFGSGVLKSGYSLVLQRSYRSGEFSVVYPVARGTGPLLATTAAIIFLGERPSLIALGGAAMIITGVFHIAGGSRLLRADRAHMHAGLRHGIACGMLIAGYTLWDRHGVAALAIAPILYDAGTSLTQFALLTPFALRRRGEVLAHWRDHRLQVLGMAILSPLAYLLVLSAMRFTPVSAIAPAREISILFGAWIGAKVLREGEPSRRLAAAGAMVVGIIAIALG
jgi:drug/metabolite transporter (DMT)-like permease